MLYGHNVLKFLNDLNVVLFGDCFSVLSLLQDVMGESFRQIRDDETYNTQKNSRWDRVESTKITFWSWAGEWDKTTIIMLCQITKQLERKSNIWNLSATVKMSLQARHFLSVVCSYQLLYFLCESSVEVFEIKYTDTYALK